MDVSTLIPTLALVTLLTGLGVGVYRLIRIRSKLKHDPDASS